MQRVPKLRSGCDVKSLPLTPADAFLLSRVDARTNEHALCLVTGFSAEQVAAMLDRLAALGAIEFEEVGSSQIRLRAIPDPGAARAPSASPPVPARSIAPVHHEPEDAGALRRKGLARKLSSTYPRTPAAAPSRPAMPATAPSRPAMPAMDHAEHASETADAYRDRAEAEARAAEIARCVEQGASALAREDFDGAIGAYRRAAGLAPDDPRVQATCAEAIRRAAGALAAGHWDQAVQEEMQERWEAAALSYAKVCAGRPDDAPAHERVAHAALRAGNVRRAVEFARKAIELSPGSAVFRVTLARAYAAAGFETSSHNELERALALAGDDARVRALVSRARSLPRKSGKVG